MKKISLIIISVMIGFAAIAQESIWSLTYDMAVPFGDTKSFNDNASFIGFTFEGQKFINDAIPVALGASVGLNTFYQQTPNAEFQYKDVTLYGTQYSYTNAVPIYFNITYHKKFENFSAFGKVGVGAIWEEERVDIGTLSFVDSDWHFALSPEVGIIYPINDDIGAIVSVKYNYGFEHDQTNSVSYLGFNIGLTW